MVKHSVALLRTQDPYFKRSGASRLTLIATDGKILTPTALVLCDASLYAYASAVPRNMI